MKNFTTWLKESHIFSGKQDEEYENKFATQVKKSAKMFMMSEAGVELDLKDWKKATKDMEKAIKSESDLTDKDMQKLYPDADIDYMSIDDPSLEEIESDNTYNRGYLAPDVNMKWYEDKEQDKYYALLNVHLGGDIRSNYSDNYWFEADDKEDSFMKVQELLMGSIYANIEFTDGSKITFDGQQDSDTEYYEVYEAGNGIAKDLKKFIGNLGKGGDTDEVVNDLVDRV